MKFQTIDDLRGAQNELKKKAKSTLPLPYPIDIEIEKPVKVRNLYVSQKDFMRASWSLMIDKANDKYIDNPIIGLEVDARTQKEFGSRSPPFSSRIVPLLRYDLTRKYTYQGLLELLPPVAVFESHVFEQVLAVFLKRGIGQGRRFLRGAYHTNLFLVHSKKGTGILVVSVTWSYKQVSATGIEGWKIVTTPLDPEKEVRYEAHLYTHSHLNL